MRVPVGGLRSYCDPGLSPEELGERLSLAGLELGQIEAVGVGSPEAFVVGRVLEVEPHPDADRLTVCRVDDGGGEPRTIVCGAPNVAVGQTVAVARPGATMPDGTRLGEATLRGVRSSGMILAEDELGIGEDHTGIVVLGDGPSPGTPLAAVLPPAERVLALGFSPNRPDCMAVYGVGREVHALTGAPLAKDPAATEAEPHGDDRVEDHAAVEIDRDVCLRFTARVFDDVTIGPSPPWLKQRLTAAGQRPISNVVDITNYVMLAVGQPLHAFDLDRVRGARIVVRRAADGERMTTLDGVERTFDREMALVCDAEGPSGIAGVMGGQVSEVSGETTRVLMEAATWVGPNILRTSSRLGLRTEASARFERQLHPELAMAAQRLAAKLMVELCGARLVRGTFDAYPRPPEPRRVRLRLPPGTPRPGPGGPPPEGPGAPLARRRRPAGGRRDRGGGPDPRPRQAPHDPPLETPGRGPADPGPALAPAARGRAPRPGGERGRLLQLHRAGHPRAAAAGRAAAAPPGEPAQRGAERDASAAAARSARHRLPQHRSRARRPRALRVRPRLRAARGGERGRRRRRTGARAGARAPPPRRAAHRGPARHLALAAAPGGLLRGAGAGRGAARGGRGGVARGARTATVPASGARRERPRRRARARLDRRAPSAGDSGVGARRRRGRGLRARPRRGRRAGARRRPVRRLLEFSGRPPGHRGRRPGRRARRRGARRRPARGRRAARGR